MASSSSDAGLTPAQKLMQRHEAHHPTVEDVVDEEFIQHPPPSSGLPNPQDTATRVAPDTTTMSANAAGKQKMADPAARAGGHGLDMKSEEAFPSLAPSKPTAAPTWGARPAFLTKHDANGASGLNGGGDMSNRSSRTSTPVSGIQTPSSTPAASMRSGGASAGGPPAISIPGRHTESITLEPSQLKPRQQMKKPAKDVLAEINRFSKAQISMKPSQRGGLVFSGQGPPEAVREALKDVARQLGAPQSAKISVPASVRPHIIGRQGATIQAISKRSGAKIQVPKPDETPVSLDDDDDADIEVVIEGDPVAAKLAKDEVENIVNQHTARGSTRLRDIPPELYPFLAGAHNARLNALQEGRDLEVKIPQFHTWADQVPMPVAEGASFLPFAPHQNYPIHLSGDRLAVQEARAQLARDAEQLRRQLTAQQVPIERGRHQFIIGEQGHGLHDFLAETGCSVILPPPGDENETLTIVGPPDRIEAGINRIEDLAASMHMANVNIAGPERHGSNLTRYLQRKLAIEQLERAHNARIMPRGGAGGPTSLDIFSPDGKAAMRARADIASLIAAHPPTRMRPLPVDPFFHQHLQQHHAHLIRDEHGVHIVVPEEDVDDEPEILLVFEGLEGPDDYQLPRRQPTAAEVRQFDMALKQAEQYIMNILSQQQGIGSKDVEVPRKFSDKVQRFVNRKEASLVPGQMTPRVKFHRQKPGPNVPLTLRGPNDAVEELAQELAALIEQEEKDEKERGYTTSFDFPQKHANQLIGKKGEHVRKLREEFDVDIQVNDGKVTVQGPKAKADACRTQILSLGKKWEDETTHVIKVPAEFHRDLIGLKGSQVNRLQDRYSVFINFPRNTSRNEQEGDDTPSSPVRRQQAPDEVFVRGPKRGADEAREELLNLLQFVKDRSHTDTVSVAQAQLPSLIGTGGREMENLRLQTGASIDVPSSREAADPSGRTQIKLKGTKKQVEEAKKLLQSRAKTFDETVTRTIEVDRKHHRALIGSGGSNIRDIVVKAGGSDDRRDIARMVRFPQPDATESTIKIEGTKTVADNIVAAIKAFADKRDNSVTEIVEVAPEKHRMLIGRGGETRRALEAEFSVTIDIPRQHTTGQARSQVKVSGDAANVELAKARILSMTKDQEGDTLHIPKHLHHSVSDNGQIFRRLRNNHNVTVDHQGHSLPSKSKLPQPRRQKMDMPLITDDQAVSPDVHFWDLHNLHEAGGDEDASQGTIPWSLRGADAASVAQARAAVEAALAEAQLQSHLGYLILPDARTHRRIIGPGGSTINSIRKATNAKIDVPKQGSGGDAIQILGREDDVVKAREMILQAIAQE